MVHRNIIYTVYLFSKYLNTSYVMVHQSWYFCFSCMAKFKYILCYGSSLQVYFWYTHSIHLNTSYVMVHPERQETLELLLAHLNTSYVMVHHIVKILDFLAEQFKYILCYGSSRSTVQYIKPQQDLNTSYVMVHHNSRYINWRHVHNLNTSYVMVHLNQKKTAPCFKKFKYILCYGSSSSNNRRIQKNAAI